MKKKFLAVVAAIGMMASLAACGGSGSASSAAPAESAKTESAAAESTKAESTAAESTKAESTAAESVAAESTAAAGELTTVNAGKLTMSTNAAFPPYEMTTDSGDFEGIDVEVAGAIAEKLGLELQIDDMDFDAALLAAQQGKSDIVMAGVSVTEERQKVMEFSKSYATGVQVVIVKEGSDIASVDDLEGKMIGTQRGTTGSIYCSDDYGDDHVTMYDNGLTAVQALNNGQVDCVVIDSEPAGLNPHSGEHGLFGNEEVDEVSPAVEELQADGTIDKIVAKYISAE